MCSDPSVCRQFTTLPWAEFLILFEQTQNEENAELDLVIEETGTYFRYSENGKHILVSEPVCHEGNVELSLYGTAQFDFKLPEFFAHVGFRSFPVTMDDNFRICFSDG